MILTIILLIISFSAMAVMYTLQFHFFTSIFKKLPVCWWCPSLSWVNKYKSKDSREPKFFGSTTIFVFVTDAWHFFQFIFLNSFSLAMAINIESYPWYWNFIGIRIIYGLVFNLFFDKILILKKK